MRHLTPAIALLLLTAACAQSSGDNASAEALQNAAEQSDPAAAAVLENAAENGMNPQDALQQAGNAQAEVAPKVSVQARPNKASDPNPVQAGEPPEKVTSNAVENSPEHAGHNMN